jgi:hypothetical protein
MPLLGRGGADSLNLLKFLPNQPTKSALPSICFVVRVLWLLALKLQISLSRKDVYVLQ